MIGGNGVEEEGWRPPVRDYNTMLVPSLLRFRRLHILRFSCSSIGPVSPQFCLQFQDTRL